MLFDECPFMNDMVNASHIELQRYFSQMYQAHSDPYQVQSRWYELRKRDVLLAALPRKHYQLAYEPGCGTGTLSVLLAERCHQLICSDSSAEAVAIATQKLRHLSKVAIQQEYLPGDWPVAHGQFDLIVLSEMLYFFDENQLHALIALCGKHLRADGTIVLCNWKHDFKQRVLATDYISERFRTMPGLSCLVRHEEEDFLLEVFSFNPKSVARQEGIV